MKFAGMTALFAGLCSVLMPSSIMAAEEEVFVFAYRAPEPKTKEFEDPKKAAAFEKVLKKRM